MPISKLMRAWLLSSFLLGAIPWLMPARAQGETPRLWAERRHSTNQMIGIPASGPDAVPCQLPGPWKVSLCIESRYGKCGHTWIRFEHAETGEVHTVSRYLKGTGGIVDAQTGQWMYEPAEVNGIQWDHDLSREHLIGTTDVCLVTARVENPRVYRGANDGYGHGVVVNNCVTHARDAWFYYSGEKYPLDQGLHTADTLLHGVMQNHPDICGDCP